MYPWNKTFRCCSVLILLAGLAESALAKEWFVAPNGSAGGEGTMASPWAIETALSHPAAVQPGDTIWLRGGIYPGIFLSRLTGTADRPIVVRNYNNESVTLDANVRTTLGQSIDSTTTTITLTDAAALNPRQGMLLLLENDPAESVSVVSVSENNVTVIRGLNGTNPRLHSAGISVRPADMDSLAIEGDYAWFWGLEFTNTEPTRVNEVAGSHPYNARNGGLTITSSQGVRVINSLLHDLGGALAVWSTARDFIAYGNIIYNNGWDAPDRRHGHGIYTQNSTPSRLFSDNIIWSSFENAINLYGSESAVLDNFTWEGNVLYGKRALFGGVAPVRNLILRNNYFYNAAPQFGYSSRKNNGLTLDGNYIPLPFIIQWWTEVSVSGNTIFNRSYSWQLDLIFDEESPPNSLATYKFWGNNYYYSKPSPTYHPEWPAQWRVSATGAGGRLLFSEWQSLGQDVGSTMTMVPVDTSGEKAQMLIPSPVIFFRKNDYDASRAHLIIYNWAKSDTVNVPAQTLNGFLGENKQYRLRSVQDYYGDIATETYAGNGLTVAMNGRAAVKPIGHDQTASWYHDSPAVASTFPEFGVFVLEILEPAILPIPKPSIQIH